MKAAKPWYAEGLRFTCQQCGNCCTGEAGFTWVSPGEVTLLAEQLQLDEALFRKRFTIQVWRGGQLLTSLKDQPGDRGRECVFFQEGLGCSVYNQRPRQCRTWPFWRRLLKNPGEWKAASQECPGIGRGALVPAATIAAIAADDGLPD